jgi:hypothetical protein
VSGLKEFVVMMQRWFQGAAAASPVTAILPLAVSAVQIAQTEMIRRDVSSLREHQQRSDELLDELSEHTRQFEQSASRTMRAHTDQLEELRASTEAGLLAIAAEAREDVRRERQERLREIARLDVTVNGLVADREREREAAARWLADARTLQRVIATTLPHEFYRPRALSDVETRLATAANNLDKDLPALQLAQEAYHQLSDLRVDLELEHREWLAGRWEAVRSVTLVKELIAHSSPLPVGSLTSAVPADMAEVAEVGIDRQSDSRLRELDAEADAVLASLEDGASPLPLAELRNVITARAPELREQVEQTIATAWQRVQASQIRANIADLVAEALEIGFAYRTRGSGYDDADLEGSFTAWLMQPVSENEVILHVRPVGDGIAATQVEIESVAHTFESDQVRRERADAIARHLRSQGIQITDPVEVRPADALPSRPTPVPAQARDGGETSAVVPARPQAESPLADTEGSNP